MSGLSLDRFFVDVPAVPADEFREMSVIMTDKSDPFEAVMFAPQKGGLPPKIVAI